MIFLSGLKKSITAGNTINWKGVGSFSKSLSGEIQFSASVNELVIEEAVPAEKVIRQKAEHMVRVGEEQRTSAQMTEWLQTPSPVKKAYWWTYALIAGLLAIMFLGWYFSEYGLDVSSMSGRKKLTPMDTITTYKVID